MTNLARQMSNSKTTHFGVMRDAFLHSGIETRDFPKNVARRNPPKLKVVPSELPSKGRARKFWDRNQLSIVLTAASVTAALIFG